MATSIHERINLMTELGLIDQIDYKDLYTIIALTKEMLKIEMTEENGGILMTHIAAAFGRNKSNESIDRLTPAVLEEIKSDDHYPASVALVNAVVDNIVNKVTEVEKEFILLHFCTLIKNSKLESEV